jgi:hypothetical protein
VNSRWLCATGAEKHCAPAALIGRFCAAPQTVRQRLDRPVPALGPVARALVALSRIFGVLALVGGLGLLAKCGWHLRQGARNWSQSYFAVFFGAAMVIVGIVYLRAPLLRSRSEAGGEASSHDR